MKKLLLFVMILIIHVWASTGLAAAGKKTIPMPDLVNPEVLMMDENQMYVVEGTTIYIYDAENFSLKKKFGKRGEGPQEFFVNPQSGSPMGLDVQSDRLIISSLGKVSFFTKDGQFDKELKVGGSGDQFQPLGSGLVGRVIYGNSETGKNMRSIRFFDKSLKKVKDIVTVEHHFQIRNRELTILRDIQFYSTWKNHLYAAWEADLKIDVFNSKGDPVRTIKHPLKRLKVTEELKQGVRDFFKTQPTLKDLITRFNIKLVFPEYLPALRAFVIDNDKLYCLTWNDTPKGTEVIVMNLDGGSPSSSFVKLEKQDVLQPYPTAIKNGKLYQLIEKDEDWELVISSI